MCLIRNVQRFQANPLPLIPLILVIASHSSIMYFSLLMLTLRAYAKINLGLRILRKREDGYHDIETVFHRVNVYDEITITPSNSVSFTCDQPDLPTDERNLCVRSARLLRHYAPGNPGAEIRLVKRIPVGAGLGGGSSDAAATLLGLKRFWNLNLTQEELFSIALELGSDVPYFLRDGSSYATGRGELLEYFPLNLPYWIVLVTPDISISTAWAYANFETSGGRDRTIRISKRVVSKVEPFEFSLRELIGKYIGDPVELQRLLHNDFESIIFPSYKTIEEIKQSMLGGGAIFAQLSGSGSSVYGFYSGEPEALSAVERFKVRNKVFLTSPHFSPSA